MARKLGSLVLVLCLAMALCVPVSAENPPEYPVVTKDFEDAASQAEWNRLGHPDGTVQVEGGELLLGSAAEFSEVAALYGQQKCQDFTAEFTFRFPEGDNNDAAMFTYRADTLAAEGYAVYFVHCPNPDRQYYIKFVSRPYQDIQAGFFFNANGEGVDYATDSVQVKMVVSGATHTLYMALPGQEYGEPVFSITEEEPRYNRSGFMGFMAWHDGGARDVTTAFDNLTITCHDEGEDPIDPEPEDPSEVVAGTVTEDFSAPLSDKWGFYRKDVGGNKVEVVDDLLLLTTMGGNVAGESAAYYKDKFQNGTIEADVILTLGNSTSIVFRGQDYMRSGYQLIFDRYAGLKLCKRPYEVLAVAEGVEVTLDVVYHAKITVDGNRIQAVVTYEGDAGEETVTLTYTDEANSFPDAGYVGFVNYAGMANKTEAMLDNLVITKVVDGGGSTDTDDTDNTGDTDDTDDTDPDDTPDNPNTGDAGLSVSILVVAAAAMGTAVLTRRRSHR